MYIEYGAWYTPKEVCEALQASLATLWRWKPGVLVPHQIGKKTIRYRGTAIPQAAKRGKRIECTATGSNKTREVN